VKTDVRELRRFGLMVGGVFGLIAVMPLVLRGAAVHGWAAVLAAGLIGLGLVWPSSLRWPFRGWMLVGHALGWVNTRVLLGLVYYLAITPLGLGMRLLGRDPLDRRLGDRTSYWIERSGGARTREEMERSF
jgi:hypothetical protein